MSSSFHDRGIRAIHLVCSSSKNTVAAEEGQTSNSQNRDSIWGYILLRFLVSKIEISPSDPLNDKITTWMSAEIASRTTRSLYARTTTVGSNHGDDPWLSNTRNSNNSNKRSLPVKYSLGLGTHWFWFRRRLFLFRRGDGTIRSFSGLIDSITIMCLGRSTVPIRNFLEYCNESSSEPNPHMTKIYSASKYGDWSRVVVKRARPLTTIHLDSARKDNIVADATRYMDDSAYEYYESHDIPYRRGYLLYGPPGTGKSSFCRALAGHFQVDLYMMNLGDGMTEETLKSLFETLPPRCILLLEDIDSSGITREGKKKAVSESDDKHTWGEAHPRVSLSALLNAIDGTASQEGRLLIMTTNNRDALDKALVRRGRVDKELYFGHVDKKGAEQLFTRIFTRHARPTDAETSESASNAQETSENLPQLAKCFAKAIPEETFTTAQLQEFLIDHRDCPHTAINEVSAWMKDELASEEERLEEQRKEKEDETAANDGKITDESEKARIADNDKE